MKQPWDSQHGSNLSGQQGESQQMQTLHSLSLVKSCKALPCKERYFLTTFIFIIIVFLFLFVLPLN